MSESIDIERLSEISLLYDFYGGLLSGKQKELFSLHHEDNYSLAEIAADLGITRQGVYDFVRRAEKSLREYEDKLGLVAGHKAKEQVIGQIEESLEKLIETNGDIAEELARVKTLTGRLRG